MVSASVDSRGSGPSEARCDSWVGCIKFASNGGRLPASGFVFGLGRFANDGKTARRDPSRFGDEISIFDEFKSGAGRARRIASCCRCSGAETCGLRSGNSTASESTPRSRRNEICSRNSEIKSFLRLFAIVVFTSDCDNLVQNPICQITF